MRSALVLGLALAATLPRPVQAGAFQLPSGVGAHPLEPIWDEDLSVIRLRYIVPRLAEPASLYAANTELVFDDMLWLCETQARRLFEPGDAPQSQGWAGAVVTLMDREVEFGVADTESLQFFEWFSFTMDGCEIDLDEYHD